MADITSASPWGAAAQAAGGILQAGIGLIQRGQANKWLKKNPQSEETMPAEIRQNQELARIRANTGLPQEQYNNAMRNIQRQQLMALRRSSDLGSGKALSIIGGVNEQGNNAVGDLDARDAQMRVNNEGQLMEANSSLAGWKSRLFDSNVRQRWLRQYNQKMGELGSGNQNLTGGIDQIAAGGLEYGASGGFGRRMPTSRGARTAGYGADFDNYGQPQ